MSPLHVMTPQFLRPLLLGRVQIFPLRVILDILAGVRELLGASLGSTPPPDGSGKGIEQTPDHQERSERLDTRHSKALEHPLRGLAPA